MLSSYVDSFSNIVIKVLREVSSDFMDGNAGWSTLKYLHNYWMDCNERKSCIHVLIRMNFNNFFDPVVQQPALPRKTDIQVNWMNVCLIQMILFEFKQSKMKHWVKSTASMAVILLKG